LLQLQSLAWASVPGYDIERTYFHDARSQQSISSVAQAPFMPFAGEIRMGLQQGTTWIRFRIHHNDPSGKLAVATAGNPLVLRVGPYSLDQVDLYESYGGSWHVTQSGAIRKNSIGNCADDLHCFSLHNDVHEASTIYIRVQTQGLRLIKTEVTPASTLLVAAAPRLAKISTELALSIAMLMLGLLFFAMQRSRLLHIYCWHQATVVVLVFASTVREKTVLVALMQAKDNTLDSGLLCGLFGDANSDRSISKHALEELVVRLRKKFKALQAEGCEQAIKSVWGVGYQLCIRVNFVH
jgi:hypothetical protein